MRRFFQDYARLRTHAGFHGWLVWMLDTSFWVVLTYRALSSFGRIRPLMLVLRVLVEKPVEFVTKVYFPASARIGGGLIVWHGHGLVVNGGVVAGENLTLYPRVCLGERWPGDKVPRIGNNCVIGVGACVLGPVEVPDDSLVPANSVVTPSDTSAIRRIRSPATHARAESSASIPK